MMVRLHAAGAVRTYCFRPNWHPHQKECRSTVVGLTGKKARLSTVMTRVINPVFVSSDPRVS